MKVKTFWLISQPMPIKTPHKNQSIALAIIYFLPLPTAEAPLCLLFHILAALVLAAFKDIPLATKLSLIFSYPAGIYFIFC